MSEKEQKLNILIGIPTGDKAAPGSSSLFLHWMGLFLKWGGNNWSLCGTSEGPPSLTRDYLVRQLLKDDKFTHLLMLDSDHFHPKDIVERLARWIEHEEGPQVISALNYQRKAPYRPAAFFFDGPQYGLLHISTWPQGLVKLDAVGASALLVAREVFERLPEPWFEFHYLPMPDGAKPRFIGEDIWFCKKLKDIGVPVYVDTMTTCPHMGEAMVGEEQFRAWVAAQPADTFRERQIDTEALQQEVTINV